MNKYRLVLLSILFFLSVIVQSQTFLISWNIQDFGQSKSTETINKITNIVKDYDIVAIQEVVAGYGGAQAVAKLADELNRKGARWDYVISNPTKSPPYKTERYAFLWKTSKVMAMGRGNLVEELQNLVYREPFEMTFRKGEKVFKVINYHSRKYDDKPEKETEPLIQYVLKQSIPTLLVGDFNISETNEVFSELYRNYFIPVLDNQKTTLKKKCKAGHYLYHSIDNIYIPTNYFEVRKSGIIDFVKECVFLQKARLISDHVPVVVHFSVN